MQRVPPLTANINQACYGCFKEEGLNIALRRCSRCRRVSYCSVECQNANWSAHKVFCKGFLAMEKDPVARMTLTFSLADAVNTDIKLLNGIAEEQAMNKARLWEIASGRQLTLIERNLIGWEPRCIACTRTDQDTRMQSAESQSAITRSLRPCPDCKMTFYCSEEHWKAVQHTHSEQSCEDGHDGLSQCRMNQEIRADIQLADVMADVKAPTGFQWAPERIKGTWETSKGATWTGEFEADLVHELGEPADPTVASLLRASSDGLSLPMTILWALKNLNENDGWTRKETLTIHILGAHDIEVMNARIFEEILHRLPEVKILRLVMCGPEIVSVVPAQQRDQVINMEACPTCRKSGRKRMHEHYAVTYHSFVTKLGEIFVQPDLAIAFNSGSSQEAVASWRETVKLLVKRKIPTVFTAYNREEAQAEARLLSGVGARLVDALGPRKNPWGSLLAKTEPNKVLGFYTVNAWLAGGFK